MKSFQSFRLDTANHLLLHGDERVSLTPKAFDVLRYLVERAGRLVTQDELLESLWPETYVNQEVLRKYILEIRKALGDKPDNPEFIETIPKRGYRFIAPVIDENTVEPPGLPTSPAIEEPAAVETMGSATSPLEQENSSGKHWPWRLAIIPM